MLLLMLLLLVVWTMMMMMMMMMMMWKIPMASTFLDDSGLDGIDFVHLSTLSSSSLLTREENWVTWTSSQRKTLLMKLTTNSKKKQDVHEKYAW
jgi:hypothetical protein